MGRAGNVCGFISEDACRFPVQDAARTVTFAPSRAKFASAALVAFGLVAVAQSAQVVDLNCAWLRTAGGQAQTVDLPDDFRMNLPWIREGGQNRGFKPETNAVYRKTFAADAAWRGRRVFVEIDGAQDVCDVKLNGRAVGSWEYGSLGFECELTSALVWDGENALEVRCSNGGPWSCRWYTGCGITRGVRLVVRDPLAFRRHGVFVSTPVVREDRAVVKVVADLVGWDGVTNEVAEVSAKVFAPDGRLLGQVRREVGFVKGSFAEVELPEFEVAHPELWRLESPRLYRVAASVSRNGRVTDSVERRFGIRTIAFGKDFGFRLNGRKVFLKGMANHQHLGALGEASHPRAWKRQLKVMKEFGYNAIRCAHNPYPEVLLDLCDEMGILVVDELVDKWRGCWAGRKPFIELAPRLVSEWVRRGRNHPSVILWSVGNETQQSEHCLPFEDGNHGITEYRYLDALVKRWDATRPTTVAMYPARAGGVMCGDPGFSEKPIPPELSCVTEVASYNYMPGDYVAYRKFDPNLIVFQSEAAVKALTSAFYLMDRESMVGISYWGAIEYWGESDGWPKKGWDYSFFRRTLEPLPHAWLIRSAFRTVAEEPIVRIGVKVRASECVRWNDVDVGSVRLASAWQAPPGGNASVCVFSNGDAVELILNGRSLGVKANDVANPYSRNQFAWDGVPFEPGVLEAVATCSGRAVARHRLETTGKAVSLRLEAENADDWNADGRDLQYVWVTAVDAEGRRVSDVAGEVALSVSGAARLLAVDDGDSRTDALFSASRAKFRVGSILAILQSAAEAGDVTLSASSETLGRASLKLKTKVQ